LPIGEVVITAVLPFGFEPSTFEREIELRDPRACSQVNFSIHPVARASGSVVDASGRPLAGVAIDAVAGELTGFDPPPDQPPVRTDERGVFEFRDLPPGVYVFGVNLTKPPYGRREGTASVPAGHGSRERSHGHRAERRRRKRRRCTAAGGTLSGLQPPVRVSFHAGEDRTAYFGIIGDVGRVTSSAPGDAR
jgi:hypothetical protein